MSNLDRRRGHTPRRAREQRAYRLVQVGGAAGLVTTVESMYYSLTAPSKGGPALHALPKVGVASSSGGTARALPGLLPRRRGRRGRLLGADLAGDQNCRKSKGDAEVTRWR